MARSRYRFFQYSPHTLPWSWRCQPLGVRGSPFGVTLTNFSTRQNLQVSVVNCSGTGLAASASLVFPGMAPIVHWPAAEPHQPALMSLIARAFFYFGTIFYESSNAPRTHRPAKKSTCTPRYSIINKGFRIIWPNDGG